MLLRFIIFIFAFFLSGYSHAVLVIDITCVKHCSVGGVNFSSPSTGCASIPDQGDFHYSWPACDGTCWGKDARTGIEGSMGVCVALPPCAADEIRKSPDYECHPDCKNGKVEREGVCQCPVGTQFNPYSNKCDASCPAPMSVQANGECSCGPGKHPHTDNYGNKMCLPDPEQDCPDTKVRDWSGACVDFSPDPNKDPGDTCPYGSYWDTTNQVCKGGSAPPKPADPGTPPGDGNPPPGGGNPPPGDGNPPPGGGNPPPGGGNPPPGDPPNPVQPPKPVEPPKPDPEDNCPAGYVNLNGNCIKVESCPPGSHSVAGNCVPDKEDPTGCPPGEVNINGTCLKVGTCPPGQYSVDGVCKPNETDPTGCPPGEVNINGNCFKVGTCPPGQHSVDGVCKPNETDPTGCPPGQVNINGNCVQTGECPPGQVLVNGKCSIKSEEPKPDTGPSTEWGKPPSVPEPQSWIVSNYKDGLPGVWNNFQSSLAQTSLIKGIDSIGSCVPSGGSCPDFTISLNFGMANFGSFNIAPPCWIWDILKAIIIITSLFTARRLIFGG